MSLQRARLREFEKVLEEDNINIYGLRELAFNGIPEINGLRSRVWKILLNYVPQNKSLRESTLSSKRKLYEQFVDEIIVSPSAVDDHPLSSKPDSGWLAYFKDNEVLLQIDKDVRRLCPDMAFFQSPTEFPCKQVVNSKGAKRLHQRVEHKALECKNIGNTTKAASRNARRKAEDEDEYRPLAEGGEAHWEVVERILFIYSKLNPGQGYVQGMNEIIGPLYHTFASDPDDQQRKYAEADCFFCFTNLMGEIRDFFIRSLDEAEGGINWMMLRLSETLERNDDEIYRRLAGQEIRNQYYSFRWLTLLLCQEFSLPDVERIWDSLFADPDRFQFLVKVCCAMIILIKDELMEGDFACNVKLLQNYPPMDVSRIVIKATQII